MRPSPRFLLVDGFFARGFFMFFHDDFGSISIQTHNIMGFCTLGTSKKNNLNL
jgi:hypothetical protein